MDKVLIMQEGDLTWIILNREKRRHAIDLEMIKQLGQALAIAEADESKVIILTGAGNQAFCSGGDLAALQEIKTELDASWMLTQMAHVLEKIFFNRKVTVAAINGVAIGGGAELATACDFRIASSQAKVGFSQGNAGKATGWGGATMLYERLSSAAAMEMLISGRLYLADEAQELGFLQGVVYELSFETGIREWVSTYTKQERSVLEMYKARFTDRFSREHFKHRLKQEVSSCSRLWGNKDNTRPPELY